MSQPHTRLARRLAGSLARPLARSRSPVPAGFPARALALSVALVPALAGCGSVISSAPVVTDADAEPEPRLVGHWAEEDGDEVVVTRGEGAVYRIEYTPVHSTGAGEDAERRKGETGTFEGRVGRLGGRLVIDVHPVIALPEPYDGTLIPGHLLFVLEFDGPDRLRLDMLNADSLFARLEAGQLELPYTARRDGEFESLVEQLVLHGGTAELRAALDGYLREADVFGEPGVLERVSAGAGSEGR